jgi:lanosterol synthase
MLTKALEFLDDQQIREDVPNQAMCYRQQRRGAWAFSNKDQGYAVSDCISEALKAVLLLQRTPGYPRLLEDQRIYDAIDTLLTYQNSSGGCASYEPTRGSERLEMLNAAEVFGQIMIEYDYPECTTIELLKSKCSKHGLYSTSETHNIRMVAGMVVGASVLLTPACLL